MKRILKSLLYLTVKAYFRSITINNIEAIPKKGPVLFVANHPSAFMDPIVITVFLNRILHYLARGESFANPVSRFIFSHLNMIPIYRATTTPDEMHKNKAVFQKCYDHLKEGGAIIIFPEGLSKTERRLRPIKTGAARITLGAEAQNDFKLGCTIVPGTAQPDIAMKGRNLLLPDLAFACHVFSNDAIHLNNSLFWILWLIPFQAHAD